ncbi:MAG: hypothetical protein IKU65_01700 [Oscillospiraceae bacterium]|nr:hypothetical protein [Oscillospiraceae bacterium]
MKDNKKKDYITNKLLLVFTIAFAMIILLMNVSRMMKSTTTFIAAQNVTLGVAWVAAAAVVLGIVMAIVEKKKNKDVEYKLLCGKNVAIGAVFVALCSFALGLVFSQSMLMLLYIFIPAVVVLYIIYYSYPREFFMIALSSAISGVGIWLLGSTLVNSRDALVIGAVVVAVVLMAAFTIWAQIGGGTVKLFGREFTPFKKGSRYAVVYLTYVLSLMVVCAAFLIPDFVLYFVLGIVAYIVLVGVYYTVKLI